MEERAVHSRRALALAAAGAAALAGCGIRAKFRSLTGPDTALWQTPPASPAALHVLNRVGYGAWPGDLQRVERMGIRAWIEEQIADSMPEDPAVAWRVNGLDVLQDTQDAPDLLASLSDDQLLEETQKAALLRAVYSRHQLREQMADFWTNHFNIYALKNRGRERIPVETERALRPHLLGKFRHLLTAVAHSGAMLSYLDSNQNRYGPHDRVNENYGRELMELHTVGVHAGYTQQDVHEVARCFSGWGVGESWRPGEFEFHTDWHDPGAKYIPFLHLSLPPNGGESDGQRVLNALAAHPATANRLARQLCQRFLGHAPRAVVEKAAEAYLQQDTSIRALLRPILLEALPDAGNCRPLFKRPFALVVSSLRALAADTDGGSALQKHLEQMGQPLYQWPMPDGFPVQAAAWQSALLPRWNFGIALVSGAIPGTTVSLESPLRMEHASDDAASVDVLTGVVLGRNAEASDLQPLRQRLLQHLQAARSIGVPDSERIAEITGLLLCSPEFQWR